MRGKIQIQTQPGVEFLILGHICTKPHISLGELSAIYDTPVESIREFCETKREVILEDESLPSEMIKVHSSRFPNGLEPDTLTLKSVFDDAIKRSLKGQDLMEVVKAKQEEQPQYKFHAAMGRTTVSQSHLMFQLLTGSGAVFAKTAKLVASGETIRSGWQIAYFGPDHDGIHWVYRYKRHSGSRKTSRGYSAGYSTAWHMVLKGLQPMDQFKWLRWY